MANDHAQTEDFQRLADRLSAAHQETQRDMDSSLRALAGGGLAVTVTVATFLEAFGTWGLVAVGCFLFALVVHLVSYLAAERALSRRHRLALRADPRAFDWDWRTRMTWILNLAAVIAFVVGTIALAGLVYNGT